MAYTYKDGFREGVVFAFYKDGEILIERRPAEKGQEIFFTSGSIEDKDFCKEDYPVHAMFREVDEEFQGQVIIDGYHYLEDLKVPEINVIFYIYVIDKWQGDMPSYTVEEGVKESDLLWIKLKDREKHFKFDSALEICRRIENYINN